ncbi:divergent polysaccharide deacetylase family protein [Marinomonas sp. THO17]|uniref:divergent polysaccharide deacetylase family protein n=1 Tax=Marinomonas sp. THO17 TaxID=3149048 RepID=UPI00336BE5C4
MLLSLQIGFSQVVIAGDNNAEEQASTMSSPAPIEDYLDWSELLPIEQAEPISPQWLGPVLPKAQDIPLIFPLQKPVQDAGSAVGTEPKPIIDAEKAWEPVVAPILQAPDTTLNQQIHAQEWLDELTDEQAYPLRKQAVDEHPKPSKIAILIDDLGYNRRGMEGSLALPTEVALAILPETPYAQQTASKAQQQSRITLLHAPMENERELKLGPGGLYAKMSEQELKAVLIKDLDGLPGIQGANNHMGSLLTTKPEAMKWVMEVLQERSMFFIDSLTSPKSVAEQTAKLHGLKTVRRDVFLDNIRTHQAIDKQFNRLLKLARRHGSALAIGHPYPETLDYLKQRLAQLEKDGVLLVPLSALLELPKK